MRKKENTSTSRPDREPKKGDPIRDPNNSPERLKENRESENKLPKNYTHKTRSPTKK